MAKKTKKAGKTTTKTTATKAQKRALDMLIVGTKAKDGILSHGCNVSGDALDGLNTWVHWLIDQAAKRATANGRKTVRAHDFYNH